MRAVRASSSLRANGVRGVRGSGSNSNSGGGGSSSSSSGG
jgi:hypothetical protein